MLLDGWRWRQERDRERTAWVIASLLSPYRKENGDPVSQADILGHSPEAEANELAQFIGAPPAAGDAAYEDVMAHQRRIRESHA